MEEPREVRPARRGPGAAGPVVAMVHGMEDTPESWTPLAEQLAATLPGGCRTYALDMPWRAGNPYRWPHRGTPAHWLREALAGLPEPADVLVGHSFGSNAVLQHLADCGPRGPEGVRAAVLVAPFYRPESLAVDWALHDAALAGFRRTMAEGTRVRLGPRAARMEDDVFSAMVDAVVDRIGPVGFLSLFLQFVGTTELDLTRTPVPTLVLAGEHDEALAGERASALAAAMPAATVRQYPHYRHCCHVERPADVAAGIAGFLRSVLPDPTPTPSPSGAGTTRT
ncbi:hypothetical protein GCM10010406_27340 [Streptomyces thermolineatus]|uniref:AB hydrolase-1 domain-containing protein n=1 Tax=Streptomyces thermolineatus TaxID=44033 RepID=A0ABN3LT31_9ACTN